MFCVRCGNQAAPLSQPPSPQWPPCPPPCRPSLPHRRPDRDIGWPNRERPATVTTLPAANEPAPLDEHNRAFWLEPSLLPALVVAWRVLRAGSARAASMLALAGFRQRNIPDHDKCRVNAQAPDHLAVLLWAEPDQRQDQAHLNLAVSDADHHLERRGTADAAVQAVSRMLGGAVLLGCAMSSPADDSVVYPAFVPGALSSSLAAAIRLGRLRSIWPGDAPMSPSSSGTTLSRHRCRST
jgi:hypothetical protein